MEITLEKCNPYIRTAEIQPAVLEGEKPRMAYDHRLLFVIDGAGKIFVENNKVIIFSLEQSRFELVSKAISRLTWEHSPRQC